MSHFFRIWLPHMIGYAELVADQRILRKSWFRGDGSETSVYYPGELLCQIDGIDTANMRGEMRERLAEHSALVDALERFLDRVEILYYWAKAVYDMPSWGQGRPPSGADQFFASDNWQKLRQEATKVVGLAHVAGFAASR